MWQHRVPQGALARLERHAGKLARAVLRGLGGSNPARLPGVDRVICPSTVTGRCCAVGFVRIGVSPKRNSRCTWVSSSLCTTSASAAKRCWVHSLRYWSRKTLESNKSDPYFGLPVFLGTPAAASPLALCSDATTLSPWEAVLAS